MKKQETKLNKAGVEKKKSKFLLIFVCIFLAIVIILGSVLGIITAVNSANAAARYEGVNLSRGALNYLSSYYKYRYMVGLAQNGVEAYDSPSFWESVGEGEEKSYGELLRDSFKEYVSGLLVANHLFSVSSRYTSEHKKAVKEKLTAVLNSHGKSVSAFNEKSAKYGFTYSDIEDAAELIYKANMAQLVLYGAEGANLKSSASETVAECEKYLATYSHVSLMFIRDENVIEKDNDGNVYLRDMTAEEKAAREEIKASMRAAIENFKSNADGKITPETFEYYYKKSDSDMDMLSTGYYFNVNAAMTQSFAEEFSEVVELALSMKVGEYAETECSIGTCFIYKYENVKGAYADQDNDYFSDFYADAVYYLYPRVLSELSKGVIFTDKFDEVDILSVPKNYEISIGF